MTANEVEERTADATVEAIPAEMTKNEMTAESTGATKSEATPSKIVEETIEDIDVPNVVETINEVSVPEKEAESKLIEFMPTEKEEKHEVNKESSLVTAEFVSDTVMQVKTTDDKEGLVAYKVEVPGKEDSEVKKASIDTRIISKAKKGIGNYSKTGECHHT